MNKIYKVIWNKNKNSYDVAPETAKNQGKQKSIMVNTGKFLAKSFIVALAVSIIGIPIDESKATIAINSNGRISVYKTNSAGEYVDKYGYATTNPDEYVLIGRQENNAVTVSGNIRGTSLATATGYRSIAIGESSKSSTNDSLAIGTWAEAGTDGDGAIVPSATGAVAIGYNSTASAIDAISLGSSSKAGGQNSISLGSQSAANGVGSISLGSNANIQGSTFNGAKANDSFSIALGSNSSATGASSISIGYAATSNSQSTTQLSGYTQGATSIGSASSAIGRQSVALGAAAQAKAEQSTAIGNDTVASGFGSISIGGDDTGYSADKDKSKVNDPYIYTQTTAVGYFKKNSSNQFNYAYRPSVATGVGAVTIGVHSQSLSDGSTAIGVSATAGDDANGVLDTPIVTAAKEATAVGAFARAKSLNSTAVGHNATAQNIKSTSIGNDATATGIQAVAIGNATLASGTSSAAIGDNAIASNENAISIGTNAQATAKNSISIGTGNKVTGAGSGAIGDPTTITGTNSYSLGNDNTIPDDNSTIVGNNNVLSQGNSGNSTSDNSHIMGNNVKVRGEGAIAIGNGVVTGDANYETGNGATENVIAIGNSSVGNGVSTLAIGTSAKAYGEKSIAIGDSALSAKDSGMKENIAIGSGAKVNKGSNSIVLGTGSYSDATNGSSIAIGFGANVTSATVSDGIAIGSNASVANTNGGVAIGKKAITTNSNGGEGSPIAIGDSSEATGTQSIAIGYNTKALHNQIGETVIGSNANATANYGTIIGYGAKGLGNQTDQTVIGHNATASNTSQYATVIGSGATATREYSTVIGTNASSTTDGGVAIGSNSVSDRQNGGNGVTDVTRNPYIPSTATEAQKSAIQSTIGTTGAVSVGSDTVKRQIINVAAGSADSDAVNVAQLKAAVSTVSSDTTAAKTTVTSKNNTVSIIPSIEQDGHTNYDLSVKTDGATITTTDGTLHAVTTGFTTNDAGNVLATTGTSLVTGADVATAINSAGFKLTTGGTTSTAGVTALVTPGSTVTIAGGKNISVAQTNNVITVNTADNVVTTDTDKYVTAGTATYNRDGSGTATLTGTNELTATVTGLKNTIVTSGTVSYDTTGAGTGTITNNDGTTASITGLVNNYVVSATPSTDGKTVTLTRNDGSKVSIDLTNTITNATDTAATNAVNKDFKLVKNPNNATDGSYSVESDGSVTLTVANNAGETQTVTIKDIASKTDGLIFTGNSGSTGLKALGSSIAVTGTNGITTTATEEGITINGSGLADTNLSNITNAGNTVISNIANKSVAITKGTNVSSVASQTVKNADGTSTTTYTINADGTTVSGSEAVTVTPGVKNTNNVTDFAVDLSDATKQTLNQVTTNTNNIAGNTTKINNLTDTVNKGWNAHVNGNLAKNVKPDDNTLNFVNGDNIVVSNENGNIKIATTNKVVTTDTDKYVTAGTATYNQNGSGTATLTGTNGLTATVSGLKNTIVTSGTVSYATDGAGTGTITNNDGTTANITGLANNYVVSATPSTDGQTVTLTRNDGSEVAIDLTNTITKVTDIAATNAANKDFKLVKNPNNAADGSYSVAADGSVTLTVANNAGETQTVTIKDIASKTDGLTFTGNSGSTGLKALGSSIAVTGTNGITTTATTEGITISGSGLADTNLSNITNTGNTVISNIANKSVAITKGTNVSSVESQTVKNADGTSTTTYTINADGTTVSGSEAVTVTPGVKNTNNVTDYKVDLSQSSKDSLTKADTAIQEIKTQIDGTDVKTVTKTDNAVNFITGDNIELTPEHGGIKVALAKDLTGLNSVMSKTITGGTVVIGSGSNTTTLTSNADGLDVGGDKITNVAPGVAGTDAVNVKQLNTTVATAKTEVKAGDNVNVVKTAGSAGNDIYTVSADLSGLGTMSSFTATSNGSTDAIKSGSIQDTDVVNFVNGTNTTADTTVKADGSGIDVTYNLNKDLTGITSISNGGTKITVGDTTSPTSNTVNFGGATITNVTPGINPGDVATVGQLSKVAAGTNVVNVTTTEDSETKATIYTVNAKGTTASAGSTAVTVKAGIADTNNVTDYKVDLSQASKDSLMKADTAIQEIKTQIDGTDVKTLTKDNNSANFVSGHNIELTSDNGAIKIATTANASYTTVTAGNTTNNTTISGDSIMFKNGDTTNTITIKEGDRNVNGDIINRVTYTTTNPDGSTHTQQGATLEDGLLFGGDDNATNTVTRKLNQQLNILGGATDVTKNNIGVKYNDENSLIVQLAKNINLGNDGSVTTGNTVVNNGGVTVKDGNSTITLSQTGLTTTDGNKTVSVTSGGLNNGGNTITNVASGNVTNTDADNTNAANIGDVKAAVQKAGDTIVKTGTKYQGDNTAVTVTRELGETLSVVGGATGTLSDNNIGVTGDANGSLKLQLAKDITGLTSVTTTDAAGNTNVMNGAGNTIANAVGDKTEVTAGNITTTNAAGDTNVMNGAGNTITNAAGDKTEVTAGNITTTDTAGNKTTINGDTITTKNAAGNTTIVNGAGVTIKNGVNDVTLTKDGLNNGNNQITNVASGGDTNTNAANIGDVKRIAGDTVTNELAKKTFGLTADDGNSATNTFDKTVGLKGDGQNISTSVNGTDVIVTMGKDLAVNTITAGKAGANGTDGTVAVNGKDGSSVVLNGKNGSIGLAGSDGKTTTISTGSDDVGVNGDNGTSRIIYTDKDGSSQKVATMNDGIKYAGDIGTVSTKLNKTTKIVGESAGKALTDSNIGVVATQDGDNAKLVVKLAKELTGLDSVSANTFTAGDTTVSTDGITINNGPSVTKTGIDAGGQTITNVAAGVNGNDAVNVNQLNEAVKNSKGSWKIDNNGSNVKEINSDANSVDFVNGNNTTVSVTGTSTGAKVKVDLANKVTIGDTTNGAPVTINGNTGTVSGLTNKTINYEGFADGSGRSATEEQVVEAANVIQQNVNRQIDGVRGAVADAGANAAAMAALKPMQYDPMEPTQVMIGAGGYKGSHAVAMGVAHYKNESTMFHAGVSVGAHDNMYNVGVTWKFGSRDEETAIPDRYKAGPISSVYVMQDEMSAVKAQNALLLSENKVQKDKLAEQDSKLATQEDRIEKLQMQIDALMAKLGM